MTRPTPRSSLLPSTPLCRSTTTSIVSASATDSDGDAGAADTQTVHVANVAATVVLDAGNDLNVNESGVTQHTYNYAISHPGTHTTTTVTTTSGANATKTAPTAPRFFSQ